MGMCGASKEEQNAGTAVTGHCRCKVVMPEGVAGEQIEGGWTPGKVSYNIDTESRMR